MTTRKYLSNRKVSTQNISLSPALKEWIERYVRVQHKENLEDERYKSISAFYCYAMETLLKNFEMGKSLDDFDRLMDPELKDYFDEISADLYLPIIEPAVALDKYSVIEFKATTRYFITFLKIWQQNVDPYKMSSVMTMFERIRLRYLYSKLTKEMSLEINQKKGEKHYSGYIEHIGTFKNLHRVNCKMMAGVLGILGFKITDFTYSEMDLYYRIDAKTTDLFFRDDLARKERFKLLEYNLEFIINYNRILNDKDYYLWMKMAEDKDIIINFKNEKAMEKWISIIEKDLKKYGTREDFLITLLKFLDRMHWIRIINEQDLEFQFEISDDDFNNEKEFVLNALSKHCRGIVEENGVYYLEK